MFKKMVRILSEFFLVHILLKTYNFLIFEDDQNSMTTFLLLWNTVNIWIHFHVACSVFCEYKKQYQEMYHVF